MTNEQTHIVVIGGGPGGYAAAFYAADLGFKVTLVNREPRLGGTCLLRGCIPSKGLLHAAALMEETRRAESWGLKFGEPRVDLDKLREFKNGYVEKLSNGVAGLAKARKVEVIEASAKFKDENTLALTASNGNALNDLGFDHCVLATGSSPVIPTVWEMEHGAMMDSSGALALKDIPKRLLVIGAGYIGLEMATVYAALGSKVTVVEAMDSLLPMVDKDLSRPLIKALDAKLDIHTGVKVDRIKLSKDYAEVTFDWQASRDGRVAPASSGPQTQAHGQAPLKFDKVLVSVGRKPNSRFLDLEAAGIEVNEKGFILHNAFMQTDNPKVWAVGDVAGEPMLAHKASAQARLAVDAIAGTKREGIGLVPAVIFTDPELAWVGLSESDAKAKGIEVKAARYPWAASGRALTLDRVEGMTKWIMDAKSEVLLGAGIVGPGAGDLISEAAVAIERGLTAHELAQVIHPHPTLSETLLESAEVLLGTATHLHRPRR